LRRALKPARCLLRAALGFGMGAAFAADPGAPAVGEVYRCHTRTGATAFVSKLDATLRDCVRQSDNAPVTSPEVQPSEAVRTERAAPVETAAEHDARLARVKTQVMQWCREHLGDKAKPNDVTACAQDKFGTYILLYP
jgi:hypothetical protein